MIKLLERTSDHLLGLVVPKVEAQADPCVGCTPGSISWTSSFCFCYQGYMDYYRGQKCESNGCHYGGTQCYARWDC